MISVFGICVIAVLTCFAMHKGVDGKAFALAVALIAGLCGYKLKDILPLRKG